MRINRDGCQLQDLNLYLSRHCLENIFIQLKLNWHLNHWLNRYNGENLQARWQNLHIINVPITGFEPVSFSTWFREHFYLIETKLACFKPQRVTWNQFYKKASIGSNYLFYANHLRLPNALWKQPSVPTRDYLL